MNFNFETILLKGNKVNVRQEDIGSRRKIQGKLYLALYRHAGIDTIRPYFHEDCHPHLYRHAGVCGVKR